MLDFVEVYAKQVMLRRIFLLVAVLLFVGMCFFAILWLISPSPKETEDFIKEYVYYRYNYDYNTVEKAYFNKLQYMPLAYREIVEPEINTVKKERIVSYFRINKISPLKKGIYEVQGHRFVFSISSNNTSNVIADEDKVLYIGEKKRKFYETDVPQ